MNGLLGSFGLDGDAPRPNREQRRAHAKIARRQAKAATKAWAKKKEQK